ncbi:FxLD family lantipeptide [Promicromonospora umidemergens]|uniref:FxLD family lantipeptide n=2 Tax=Promicromonospora TaxID=43676 RepID=A0ABP8Y5W7_9MICO|nr:FxLD family lanthipeptide [Promicromonospora umidemergens]MCP2286810.1 FxLD family lantipeptide [Promicromonospora umidemergens]
MTPPLTLDAPALSLDSALLDDDFELDLRVIESTTPLVATMCSTSDGCGSSCSNSACTTGKNTPF